MLYVVDNRFTLNDNACECLGYIKEDIQFHSFDCVTRV